MGIRLFLPILLIILAGCAAAVKYTAQYEPTEPQDKKVRTGMIEIGSIYSDEIKVAQLKIDDQVESGNKQIVLRINSNGGGIFTGLDFIQYLDELKKDGVRITCVVDHRAISMAFVILQAACDERLATDRALFLAHNGSVKSEGGTKEDLEEDVDLLATLNENMARICSKRMGMKLEEYKKHLHDKKSWIFGPEEALRVHAIDKIVDPKDLPPVAK